MKDITKRIDREIMAIPLFKQFEPRSCWYRYNREEPLPLRYLWNNRLRHPILQRLKRAKKKRKQTTSIYKFISTEFVFSRHMTNPLRLVFDFKVRYQDEASR